MLFFDRVAETTTTTGTGSITLAGAKTGYQSFGVVGTGGGALYTITDNTNWEVGSSIYSAGTLTRSVTASSNSNQLVNFSAGSKDVFFPLSANFVSYQTMRLLATATSSDDATVDFTFTNWTNSNFAAYKVVITNLAPATDGVEFWLRTSSDGGSTYDAGASDYANGRYGVITGSAGVVEETDTADSEIELLGGAGNAANESGSGEVLICDPSAANYCKAISLFSYFVNTGVLAIISGGGVRLSAADVDAIRFMFSSGNIASGEFRLYGLPDTGV